MMNHTKDIYNWMHQLIEGGHYQNVAYDANWLYASDRISLYQVARACITWKDWQKAHEECWNTEGWQWRKGDANEGELACGSFNVDHSSNKAPKLSSVYAIIGDAVQSEMLGDVQTFKASHASKQWILQQERFFGALFNQYRISTALDLPLFAKCQFALLENGALRIANKKRATVIVYVMSMNG